MPELTPPVIADVLQQRTPVHDVNTEYHEQITGLEKLALFISDRVGTPGFFLLIVLWTFLWLTWNFLAPAALKFDPPMSFVFWLFISNMIQIFLMPLLMVAQNLQSRHSELRAQNDFEVNVKAEREVEAILRHLEYQNSLLLALLEKQGVRMDEIKSALQDDGARG